MAKTRKYTVDEFVKSLRENDPYFQSEYWQNQTDRDIYNIGVELYPAAKKTVEHLPRTQLPMYDPGAMSEEEEFVINSTSPGYIKSIMRWGIDNESAEWKKQAWANSLGGLAVLARDGKLEGMEIDPNWDPHWSEEILSGILSFMFPADLATLAVTGGVGNLAAQGGGKLAVKYGGKKIIQRQISSNLAKKGLENRVVDLAAKYGIRDKIATDVAKGMVSQSIMLGAYEGAKGGLAATYQGTDVWDGIWKGVVHGGVTGAALGGTGGFLGSAHKNLLFAKDIKLKKTKAFGAKDLTKAEQASWDKLVGTRYYKNKSLEQIDRGLRFTGPLGKYAGEVTAFTATGNVFKYLEGEEINLGTIWQDFLFNAGFVGTMRGTHILRNKTLGMGKKILGVKTQEQKDMAERAKNMEKELKDVTDVLEPEIENPTTKSSKKINEIVKEATVEELKANDESLLKLKGVRDLREAMHELEISGKMISKVSSKEDLQNWYIELGRVMDDLNVADELIRIARKDKPETYGWTLEEISTWKRQVDAERERINKYFRRQKGVESEREDIESAERASLMNFIADKIDKKPSIEKAPPEVLVEKVPEIGEVKEKEYQPSQRRVELIKQKRKRKIDKMREKFPEEEGYEIDDFTKDVGREYKIEQNVKIVGVEKDSSLPKGKRIVERVVSPAVKKDGNIVKPPEYVVREGTRELTQKEIDAQYKIDIANWKEEVKVAKEIGAKIPPRPVKAPPEVLAVEPVTKPKKETFLDKARRAEAKKAEAKGIKRSLETLEKWYEEQKTKFLERNPTKNVADWINAQIGGLGRAYTIMRSVLTDKASKKIEGWSKKEIREYQKETMDSLTKWYDKNLAPILTMIEKESLKGKTLNEIFAENPSWYRQIAAVKARIEAIKEEIRTAKDPRLVEGIEGHLIVEKKLMEVLNYFNKIEAKKPSVEGKPRPGIGRLTADGDYMIPRSDKKGGIEEVNIIDATNAELLAHKELMVEAGIEYTRTIDVDKITYESIAKSVKEKALLDYVEDDPLIQRIKDIKVDKRSYAEKELVTKHTHKKLITESNLNEKNKTILAHSLGEIAATEPAPKSTKEAIELLKHVEKRYNGKGIDELTPSQLEGLLADYINTKLENEVISRSTNQPKKTSTLIEKVFGGDLNKANYAEIAIQRIVNNLKHHFHKGTGIQEIIGGDILKPKSFTVKRPGTNIEQIRPSQAEKTTQKAVSIPGGVEGLRRWSQFIKNRYKESFTLDTKEISREDISLLMDVLTAGAGRPGEPTTIRAGKINVKNGMITVGQSGKDIREVNIGIELAKRLKKYASDNKLKGDDVLFFNHIESKNRTKWLNLLFSDVIKSTNDYNVGKSGSEKVPAPFIKHLFELKDYPFDPKELTRKVKVGPFEFGGKSITEKISPADVFRRILEISRVKDPRERGHTEKAERSYGKAGEYPEIEGQKELPIDVAGKLPLVHTPESWIDKTPKKYAKELAKNAYKEEFKSGKETLESLEKIAESWIDDAKKRKKLHQENPEQYYKNEIKRLKSSIKFDKEWVKQPENKESTILYWTKRDIKLNEQRLEIAEKALKEVKELGLKKLPLGGVGGEELAPPVPIKERLIYALESGKAIHKGKIQADEPLSKKLRPHHERSIKEKEEVKTALQDGGYIFIPKAIEYVRKWRKGHLDWLDNPKNKNQPPVDIQWNKNWAKTYTQMLSTLRLEKPGAQRPYGKIEMVRGEPVERPTAKIRKHAFALRDARGKSFESRDLENMFPDMGFKKVKQLGEAELLEYINQVRNVEAPKSKFGPLEQKIKDMIKFDYKNLERDDVTDMLIRLGVKDGLWENITRKETLENIQLLLKNYEPRADYPSATDFILSLKPESGKLPKLSTIGKAWHSPAAMLKRTARKLEKSSPKLSKALDAIADKMYDFEVRTAFYRDWTTKTKESVDSILAGTEWKKHKYMFQFIDKTFPRDNLTSKEKRFIELLESKDPNPINQSKKVIDTMFKKYMQELEKLVITGKWATKVSKEDFVKYISTMRIKEYYNRRVTIPVLDAIRNMDGPVYELLLKKNLDKGAKAAANKLERRVIDKVTGELEGSDAFNARKASFRVKWKKDTKNIEAIKKDIMRFFNQSAARFDLAFLKERTFTLPRKSKIRKGKKIIEVDSYVENFDSIIGHYGAGFSKFLSILRYFPEFTKIGEVFGGKSDKGLGKSLFEVFTAKSKEFGVNQDWVGFIKLSLEQGLGMESAESASKNRGLKRKLGITTSTLAAAGLSSFTSGLKNLAIGIPRAIGLFGTMRTGIAMYRFMTNHEKLQELNIDWVKEYGSKQIAMEAQATLWEKVPFAGKYLSMDAIFRWNLMTQTEGVNRIVSAYAGHMMFESFLAAHHDVGGFGDMPMGGKKEIQRAMREVWKLSEKEIEYSLETPYHELQTKNPELMSWITTKVQQYSHMSAQGSTTPFQLPSWMSTPYMKHLTLFHRMAQSTTADIMTNFLKPAAKLQNIAPLLRATVAHSLSGLALYKFYEQFLGYEVPHRLDDNWTKGWLPPLWRSEFFGLFGEFFNPHTSPLYDKKRGLFDLWSHNQDMAGIIQPVHFRTLKSLRENVPEMLKNMGILPESWAGKPNKHFKQALFDLSTEAVVLFGQGAKLLDAQNADLLTHKQLKSVTIEWMKSKGYFNKNLYGPTHRQPYYRDLRRAFWKDTEEEFAIKYWAAHNFIAGELMDRESVNPGAATKQARFALRSVMKKMAPLSLTQQKNGREISKRDEFLRFISKDPRTLKLAKNLQIKFEYKNRKLQQAMNKYKSRYSILPNY